MSIDMSVIEFSDEVRDLARQLSRSPKPVSAVSAIADSGLFLDTAQFYAQRNPVDHDRLNQSLAIERVRQKALKDAGIVDDATAISYLDRVRPIMEGWAAQLDALQGRHAEEIRDLANGWVDL
jgi:hypothetical protein